MTDDPDEHVAMMFHGLVTTLQHNDVAQFDEDLKRQAEARAALRKASQARGMTASELLKAMDGDPDEAERRVQAVLDKVDREAKAAAASKEKNRQEPLPEGSFPPPPESG